MKVKTIATPKQPLKNALCAFHFSTLTHSTAKEVFFGSIFIRYHRRHHHYQHHHCYRYRYRYRDRDRHFFISKWRTG